jgi:hypothetical protein
MHKRLIRGESIIDSMMLWRNWCHLGDLYVRALVAFLLPPGRATTQTFSRKSDA